MSILILVFLELLRLRSYCFSSLFKVGKLLAEIDK